MPPELAAATGFRDASADNSNAGKSDNAQNDWTKGSARFRAQIVSFDFYSPFPRI